MSSTLSTQSYINDDINNMKRKNINIKETDLLSVNEQTKIRGGAERHRWKSADGTKTKVILPDADAAEMECEE